MIKSTHFFAVLLILGSSLIHGQDSANPGNGLLFNPLDRDVDLIVKPITGDAEEKEFKIAPGSRIELQQYKSYDIFIPSAKDVYRLDVSKESTADSGKSYFSPMHGKRPWNLPNRYKPSGQQGVVNRVQRFRGPSCNAGY
jgi:hypothetical protein